MGGVEDKAEFLVTGDPLHQVFEVDTLNKPVSHLENSCDNDEGGITNLY